MSTEKRRYTLRLHDDTFENIKYIAEKSKRSIAMQIEYILEKYVAEFEKENGPISAPTEK